MRVAAAFLLLSGSLMGDTSSRSRPRGMVACFEFAGGQAGETRSGRTFELVKSQPSGEGLVLDRGWAILKDAGIGSTTESLTIEAWLRMDTLRDTWSVIVARGVNGDHVGENYGLWVGYQGWVAFHADRKQRVRTEFGAVRVGEWTHLVATLDAVSGEARVYVNGTLIAKKTGQGGAGRYAGPIWIGGWEKPQYQAHACIRRVRIYDRPLAPRDVESLWRRK